MTSSGDQTKIEGKSGNVIMLLWRRLTTPRAKQEDDARREYMIKVILVINSLFSFSFTLIAIFGYLFQVIPLDTVLILGIIDILFTIAWVRTYQGHWRFGGVIPCLVYLIAGLYGNYVGGIDAPAMLLYALAIVLAAIMLDTHTLVVLLILSLAGYLGLGLAHNYGYLTSLRDASNMFVNRVSIVLTALAAISSGVWFLKDQYQRSITQVRANAQSTRAIFETVTDGIVLTDLSGKILDINGAMIRMFQFNSKEQVLGQRVLNFIVVEDHSRAREFSDLMLSGTPGKLLSCKGKLLDGKEIFLEISAAVFMNTKGQPAGYVSAVRDITQRKQAEDELTRYQEHLEDLVAERTSRLNEAYSELESFSYSVSHDLRSPLRRIEGFSKILSEDFADQLSEQGLMYIKRIIDGSQRMSELINDLLTFSRLIRQPVTCQHIHPGDIARSVADELMGGEYSKQNTEILIQDMPACDADRTLLRQVYFNLLDNAFKYSRNQEKPRIEVGSKPGEDGQTIYYVFDNGIGFDMQYADRIFGVFQRLHSDSKYEGTGIGLATVQRIISRHNGKIWMESAVNQGAKFYFTLGRPQS